ncbi:hypothetical protein DET49_106145 [Salegentibacter sp. 24]|uniref:hypothetical protein n=1 Tax=Salegentibacter sp. 24 TaxID=2183986 RepID=UPI00105F93F6|nr:hypothetical protein [Salegentibacter sp. 24]TDN89400.1 hypothetical protein DET49_106145 [Salegentibacter sp. 24]
MKFPKTFFIVLVCLILSSSSLSAQANQTEAAIFNIGIGSIFSGVGALINKKPQQKLERVIFKGMAQGALGGYLVYESKVIAGLIAKEKNLMYGWPAKIINSAGTSIIENAASNRDFWEQWNLNIGFNRIEFHTKDRLQVKYRIQPVAFLLTTYIALQNKFEPTLSLRVGEFVFSGNTYYRSDKNSFLGSAIGTSILLNPETGGFNYGTVAHEMVHVFQYHDFNVLNTYLNTPIEQFKEGSSFFQQMDRLFHYDFNVFIFAGLYKMEHFKKNQKTFEGYYSNYFEKEAYLFSEY